METSQIFDLFGRINELPWPLNLIVWIVLVGGVAVTLFIKTIEFVPESEVGLRTRFGAVKAPNNELGPGPHLMFPFAHNIVKISMRHRTIGLQGIRIPLSAFNVIHVQATITFKVVRAYNVQFLVDNFDERLRAACERAIRQSFYEAKRHTGTADVDAKVLELFREYISETATYLGVSLLAVEVQEALPDPAYVNSAALAGIGDVDHVLELLSAVTDNETLNRPTKS